jgi:PleD family two-component response regulator
MENKGKICLLLDYQSAFVDAVEDMLNLHYISLTKVTKKDYDHKKDKIETAFDLFVILMETHTDYELLKSVTSQHEPDNKAIILIFADIHLVNKSKIFTRENIDYIIPPFLRSEFENKLNLILQNKQIKQHPLKKNRQKQQQ